MLVFFIYIQLNLQLFDSLGIYAFGRREQIYRQSTCMMQLVRIDSKVAGHQFDQTRSLVGLGLMDASSSFSGPGYCCTHACNQDADDQTCRGTCIWSPRGQRVISRIGQRFALVGSSQQASKHYSCMGDSMHGHQTAWL